MLSLLLPLLSIGATTQIRPHTVTTITFLDRTGKVMTPGGYTLTSRDPGKADSLPLNLSETADAQDDPPSVAAIKATQGTHYFKINLATAIAQGDEAVAKLQRLAALVVTVQIDDVSTYPTGHPFKDRFLLKGVSGLTFEHPVGSGAYPVDIKLTNALTAIPLWSNN